MLAEHGHHDNRLMIGLLHKTRAEVAIAMSDAAAFEVHASEMEHRFRSTRNPELITQCERLLDRAARLGLRELEPMVIEDAEAVHDLRTSTGTSPDPAAAPDACARALTLVMSRVNARCGFLYLRRGGVMHLSASSGDDKPPESFELALSELAEHAGLQRVPRAAQPSPGPFDSVVSSTLSPTSTVSSLIHTDDDLGETQAIIGHAPVESLPRALPQSANPSRGHQLVLLECRHAQRQLVVGGLILETSAADVAGLRQGLLRGIAQVLLGTQPSFS